MKKDVIQILKAVYIHTHTHTHTLSKLLALPTSLPCAIYIVYYG